MNSRFWDVLVKCKIVRGRKTIKVVGDFNSFSTGIRDRWPFSRTRRYLSVSLCVCFEFISNTFSNSLTRCVTAMNIPGILIGLAFGTRNTTDKTTQPFSDIRSAYTSTTRQPYACRSVRQRCTCKTTDGYRSRTTRKCIVLRSVSARPDKELIVGSERRGVCVLPVIVLFVANVFAYDMIYYTRARRHKNICTLVDIKRVLRIKRLHMRTGGESASVADTN